ncbi:hypothetical protein Back11_60760 [Paenibacillus baekrokdamisoli]|uniref:Uncharacterized protein n=1 Tax=Paenibacillus baekrokdamisoli TaxID=1712516 RepID=A0A3G9JFQ4_9BACL|nr:S-layer homology domain-containing protein [Paenibacillus baekrokdamisoli]MBB3072146.1 hypothetical protein [Paenibacillus baekrokdamisoli]BBH24731.1 hypothetical protein Back11_60760 [Paenibacillus baekrokdamisoli]
MLRRWTIGIISFVLLFTLAMPVRSNAAVGDNINPDANQEQKVLETLNQDLPLPNSTESENVDSAGGTTLNPGKIQMGEIDGYSVSPYNNASIFYNDENGANSRDLKIVNGIIDLGMVQLPPKAKITISLTALYTQKSTGKSLLYIDEDTMTSEELVALSNWTIDMDAVEVPLDHSSFADWTYPQLRVSFGNVSVNANISNMSELSILSKPGKLELSYSGVKNREGYLIRKTFNVFSGTNLVFNKEDVSAASVTQLPGGLRNINLWGAGVSAGFQDIDDLIVTEGVYSLRADQSAPIDGGERITSWTIVDFEVKGNRELHFDVPKLSIQYLNISAERLSSIVVVNNGDFQLSDIYEQIGSEWKHSINLHIKIADSQGQSVYETDVSPNSWCCYDHTFDTPLKGGSYTVEFSMNGLEQPLSLNKSVLIKSAPEYDGKGLVIHTENEAGQPLADGQVFLFEKQPPWIGGANDGEAVYSTLLTYKSKKSSDGSFIIPYQKLLKGRSYELEVVGTSADGQHKVLYHRPVSRDDKYIQFKSSNLKHITIKAAQANEGDSLLLSVLDDHEQFSSWPALALFGNNHQAEVYIQTDNKISMLTKLYDASTDTGYFLTRTVAPNGGNVQTIDLNGETAEIRLPAGFENAKLDVNDAFSKEERFAKRYLVSKGNDVTASYYVESGAYRYTFSKYLGKVKKDITLGIGHDFVNRRIENQFFIAGKLNQRVYTDYMDELDNNLVDVSHVVVAKIADRIETEGITFTVGSARQKQVMSIQDIEDGLSYAPLDQPVGTNQIVVGGSTLDYQMYNSDNQKIGDTVHSSDPLLVHTDIPIQSGDYSLKLTNQNFPSDVVKLTGQANITAISRSEQITRIPIELPPSYQKGSISYSNVVLQPLNDTSSPVYLWMEDGMLCTYPPTLDLDQKYALHLAINLISSSGERVLYYNQLLLTGSEFVNLKKVAYVSSAITISPEVSDLPKDFLQRDIQLEFPVINFKEKSFSTYASQSYGSLGKIKINKIIMKPQDFVLVFNGWDGDSTGYNLRREVHTDAVTGKWTLRDPGTHLLQLQGNHPFITFNSLAPGENRYSFNYYYDGKLMDKAYVSPGKQQFQFVTGTSSPEEEPWNLYWMTNNTYDVDKDTVIPFTGHVDLSKSSLTIAQRTEGDKIVLTMKPELMSGDLKLKDISLGKSGGYNYVPAIVTIKDSHQNKVYEALAYNWYGSLEVSKALTSGTYSVAYSQPVGPNEEAVVTNSFTVPANGGGFPGGGGGGGIIPPGVDQSTDTVSSKTTIFKPEDIPAALDGVVTLQIKDSEAVVIPANILSGDGTKNVLELTGTHGKVSIPPAVLKQLTELVGKDKLADAQFSLSLTSISDSELSGTVKAVSGTDFKKAGTVYDFKLSITAKDSKSILLTTFDEPITLTFEVDPNAVKHLTNVYYISEDGNLTYLPSKQDNGMLVAKVTHFSKYGVLQVKKAFADVSAAHWAHDAIEELAAKQFVEGTTPDKFAPNRLVTRAEFTVMLVHALGLSTEQPSVFKDVPVTAWYASAVAAAYQNNLVKGISEDSFAPSRPISREEMAVILKNALKHMNAASSASKDVTFKDSVKISSWAVDAVGFALANGLIKGDGSGMFIPKGMTTRAEAAQMLVNLLNQANK